MKKGLILILLVTSLISTAAADVLITRRIHVNSFYHEGVQRPERTDTVDLWIARDRAACLVGAAKIIVDADRDLVILVNDAAKTYAEAALSRPVVESMTSDDREAMPGHETTVRLNRADGTRTVGGRVCHAYAIEIRSNLTHKATAWVSAEVPVDLGAFRALMTKLYAFLGRYDADSANALLGIPGLVLAQESVADLKGETVRINRDVVEVGEKTPPEGLYSVPGGYVKKPGLTHADVDLIASILE
jgi:hypothetical protein